MTDKKTRIHYTAEYLIDPPHPVTVNVIGAGGTGSQVAMTLARMNVGLRALGHPGIWARIIDDDRITEANPGRQLFSKSDIDEYKCVALVGRINQFYGTKWDAMPARFGQDAVKSANITISCVDSGAARKAIRTEVMKPFVGGRHRHPYEVEYYWMDFGNMKDRGQAILGTIISIRQPKSTDFDCISVLPTVDKVHPDILRDKKGEDQGPSCSLAESLSRQDLLINTNLANMGLGLLWKMFRELRTRHRGVYLNMDELTCNSLKV